MKYSDSRIILSTLYIYLLPITTSNHNFNCISILFLDLSINRLYHGFYPTVVEIQIVTSYIALYGALRLSPLETLVVFGENRRISKPGSRAGRETGGASRTLVQVTSYGPSNRRSENGEITLH